MFTNISCYQFAPLGDLKALRSRLLDFCSDRELKGTILLSTEGINVFVAGARNGVDDLVGLLQGIPGLAELTPKYSESGEQPFTRMLIRIKKEIIAFGVEGIEPGRRTSPKVSPGTLKQWLDEGRKVTLLDTRNDYEVKLGTFEGALELGIPNFRNLPAAVAKLPEALKEAPIVMFCTGGIRCEKAGPFMERQGFRNVFQLDGGILKYFEECGGAHYRGECFVFDQRVGVDPALQETPSTQCYVCQTPLTMEEQSDPRYVAGLSCPYCHRTEEEAMMASITKREAAMAKLADPLPGSIPYDNVRPLLVPPDGGGLTLLDLLCRIFSHQPRSRWNELCAAGRFLAKDGTPAAASRVVRSGERYRCLMPGITEPDVNANIRILHEDSAIVVVDKPAPLPTHPSGRFNKNTLQHFLAHAYAPERPRPMHRLDANTTGVTVWSRTRHFARLLQPQFEVGSVEKIYLARVVGHPTEEAFSCEARISTEPGEHGSRQPDDNGLSAHTDFRVLHRDPDGTSLLEARPQTGRTNQIRVHLWLQRLPVCGDPFYLPHGQTGEAITLLPSQPPLCLHSLGISFTHPVNRQFVTFRSSPPEWASQR